MDLGLRERVAIVGGSSRGMGKATALALAREGASVTISARTEPDLRKTEMEIARISSQQHVLAIPADLSRPEDIKRVVRNTFNRFGRLDILVANLGGPPTGKPSELDDDKWKEALDLNFLSVVRICREVIPFMKQQQWGRIINLLSSTVKQPVNGLALSTASRLAVVGYAKTLADELGSFNITVNNVLPGAVLTDRFTSLNEAKASELEVNPALLIKESTDKIPMGRLGRSDEMGDLITFLASDRAGYLTGASIPLDGGAIMATL